MANVYRNIFIYGLGETRSGQSLVAGRRRYDDSRAAARVNRTQTDPLLDATTYAYFANRQEAYLAIAAETGASTYSLAIADWFEAPRVLQIDVDAWTGKPGQAIRVKARDNVAVAAVTLVICDAKGNVLESGEAVQAGAGSPWWRYTMRSRIPMTPFPVVEAIARDLAGNSDSFTI